MTHRMAASATNTATVALALVCAIAAKPAASHGGRPPTLPPQEPRRLHVMASAAGTGEPTRGAGRKISQVRSEPPPVRGRTDPRQSIEQSAQQKLDTLISPELVPCDVTGCLFSGELLALVCGDSVRAASLKSPRGSQPFLVDCATRALDSVCAPSLPWPLGIGDQLELHLQLSSGSYASRTFSLAGPQTAYFLGYASIDAVNDKRRWMQLQPLRPRADEPHPFGLVIFEDSMAPWVPGFRFYFASRECPSQDNSRVPAQMIVDVASTTALLTDEARQNVTLTVESELRASGPFAYAFDAKEVFLKASALVDPLVGCDSRVQGTPQTCGPMSPFPWTRVRELRLGPSREKMETSIKVSFSPANYAGLIEQGSGQWRKTLAYPVPDAWGQVFYQVILDDGSKSDVLRAGYRAPMWGE